MKKLFLIKVGEIILKGLNRKSFESKLIKNIKSALDGGNECKVISTQSIIHMLNLFMMMQIIEDICDRINKVV